MLNECQNLSLIVNKERKPKLYFGSRRVGNVGRENKNKWIPISVANIVDGVFFFFYPKEWVVDRVVRVYATGGLDLIQRIMGV